MAGSRRRQPDNTTPEDWLFLAEHDCQDADALLATGGWNNAGFLAIQAVEKGLKALARKHTTFDDLETQTWSELEAFTWDEIEAGGDQANSHNLIRLVELLRPWHRDDFDQFRAVFDWIDSNRLYEMLRYPTAAAPQQAAPAAALVFGEADARRLREAARALLEVVRSHL